MSEFSKFPSTDDSAESLKHRPKSPVNRNWNWSPKAPGSHHVIESVNFKGDEASENILPKNIEGSDPEAERKEFNQDEIMKKKLVSDIHESENDENSGSEELEEYEESDEEQHAIAVNIGMQIVLAAIQKSREERYGKN